MEAVKMTIAESTSLFREFLEVTDFKACIEAFNKLCAGVGVDNSDHKTVYKSLKTAIQCNEARTLWRLLDNRQGQVAYNAGLVATDKQVLIIGAGPCGLRMAIEVALLGGCAVVVEMRDYMARNNVLHLWPFVIHDLKLIGAKVFFPKFCGGNREHISILRLQMILLKISLVLGVQVHAPITFHDMLEPTTDRGWRAKVTPEDHPVSSIDFDAVVAADGKNNSLKCFKRKTFRGKLALGITANFVNEKTNIDNAVDEIGGLFYVYSRPFFDNLRDKVGVELENFVYFKDDTHYFVMTAKKDSLIKRGVIKQDIKETTNLLSRDNIDHSELVRYVRDAADIATKHQLAERPFALNQWGQEDVAIFDFTALSLAEHSCMAIERENKSLLLNIVGDSLIEPFWPTGSGVAKGFLSVLDTAWLLRGWFLREKKPLDLIAERETIFKALPQTKPDNLGRVMNKYTIDPSTRYGPGLVDAKRVASQVSHLYVTTAVPEAKNEIMEPVPTRASVKRRRLLQQGETTKQALIAWYQSELKAFEKEIKVTDLSMSWRDGRALLAVLSIHRPELVDFAKVVPSKSMANCKMAFDIIQQEFGITPVLTPIEMASTKGPDKLSLMSYLTQLQYAITQERSPSTSPTKEKENVPKSTPADKSKSNLPPSGKPPMSGGKAPIKRRLSAKAMLKETSKKQKTIVNRKTTLERCNEQGIAKKRIQAFQKKNDNQSPPPVPKRSQPIQNASSSVPPSGDSKVCCICNEPLFIVERHTAHGLFFHKDCFKCAICRTMLVEEECTPQIDDKGIIKFLCLRHATDIDIPTADETDGPFADEMSPYLNLDLSEMMGLMSMTMKTSGDNASASEAEDELTVFGDEEIDLDLEDFDLISDDGSRTSTLLPDDDISQPKSGTLRRKRTFYSLANSLRLLTGYEIQRQLEEASEQESELEEMGKHMEKYLRRKTFGGGADQEELTQQWLDVMQEKQELQEEKNRLMLRAKLLELQDRQQQLQAEINSITTAMDMTEHPSPVRKSVSSAKASTSSSSDSPPPLPKRASHMKPVLPPRKKERTESVLQFTAPVETELSELEQLAKQIQWYFKEPKETSV